MNDNESPIEKIYRQMHETAEAAGMPIISADRACRLLAWLLAYGGANEAVTLNYKLRLDIQAAQRRLNIDGGETPNRELAPLLKSYWQEVKPWLDGANESYEHPAWVVEIFNCYEIKVPK